jgi:hypothetical protein
MTKASDPTKDNEFQNIAQTFLRTKSQPRKCEAKKVVKHAKSEAQSS